MPVYAPPPPAGIVAFFVSYLYMDQIISKWHDMGVLQEIMQHKLIFIETQVCACVHSWSGREASHDLNHARFVVAFTQHLTAHKLFH